MKRFILLLGLLALTHLNAQWPLRWIHPTPTGSDLIDVYPFSLQSLVAAGDNGCILRKTEGGDWQLTEQKDGYQTQFRRIIFLNEQEGWLIGHNWTGKQLSRIYKTTDGGSSWNLLSEIEDTRIFGGYFLDAQTGWLASSHGAIYKTADGGQTWSKVDTQINEILFAVCFMDADTGWVTGEKGTILRTTDGGITWTDVSVPTFYDLGSMSFPASAGGRVGWITGGVGLVYRTTDFGRTWQLLETGITNHLMSIYFINDSLGWLAGSNGSVFVTQDSGYTWQQQTTNRWETINSIRFLDEQRGMAVGDYGLVLVTADGGATWQTLNNNLFQSYICFLKVDPHNVLWCGAKDGVLMRSTDWGKTWKITDLSTYSDIYSMACSSPDTFWLAGAWLLRRSTDGGQTWEDMGDLGYTKEFKQIRFHNSKEGWILTETGELFHTTDGGDNWLKKELGFNATWEQLEFLGPDTLILRGNWVTWQSKDAYLMLSTDRGETWTQIKHSVWSQYKHMIFVDSRHGWFVDNWEDLWYTRDGGVTWSRRYDFDGDMTKIVFIDTLRGWYANDYYVYRTLDGGKSWEKYDQVWFSFDPTNIYVFNPDTLWMTTRFGKILQLPLSGLVGMESTAPQMPTAIHLFQNYPNPFNPATTIAFELPRNGEITLRVFDVLGRRARTLAKGRMTAGQHTVIWDGRNDAGRPVSSGIYFYRLQTKNAIRMQKMLLTR